MKEASAAWQGLFFGSAPAKRSGDGALCPTNFSLSLQVEGCNSIDKLKFVGHRAKR
jgi:hypothetical protein